MKIIRVRQAGFVESNLSKFIDIEGSTQEAASSVIVEGLRIRDPNLFVIAGFNDEVLAGFVIAMSPPASENGVIWQIYVSDPKDVSTASRLLEFVKKWLGDNGKQAIRYAVVRHKHHDKYLHAAGFEVVGKIYQHSFRQENEVLDDTEDTSEVPAAKLPEPTLLDVTADATIAPDAEPTEIATAEADISDDLFSHAGTDLSSRANIPRPETSVDDSDGGDSERGVESDPRSQHLTRVQQMYSGD
jgi:hypothetical protein